MTDKTGVPMYNPDNPVGLRTSPDTMMAVIGCLIHLAGGRVVVPQSMFDLITGMRLTEEYDPDTDVVTLTLTTPDRKEH